jgi:putative flippase GtrA
MGRLALHRVGSQLRDRDSNARELVRFCVVGGSGYLVNLGVYAVLLHAGLYYLAAAAGSFAVAVVNNYSWNRLWTFRGRRGSLGGQGLRFLVVSLGSLGANLLLLHAMVGLQVGKVPGQAIIIVLVAPMSFLGSKVWAFAQPQPAVGG